MHLSFFAFSFLVAIVALALFSGIASTWRRYRGKRLITCPDNRETAAVDVDAWHAATRAQLRLTSCSRWPEKEGCGQECLAQVESSPEVCLVQAIVATWYAGKHCAACNREIGPVVWHERPPALLAADGTTHEWPDVAPQELPKIFRTHQPLCWQCHNTESFRRETPQLVIERRRPVEPRQVLKPTTAVY